MIFRSDKRPEGLFFFRATALVPEERKDLESIDDHQLTDSLVPEKKMCFPVLRYGGNVNDLFHFPELLQHLDRTGYKFLPRLPDPSCINLAYHGRSMIAQGSFYDHGNHFDLVHEFGGIVLIRIPGKGGEGLFQVAERGRIRPAQII